jgi:large subunit ribosomal protein L6
MSRIGRHPVSIPAGVQVSIDGRRISVKGPKGSLELDVHPAVTVEHDGREIRVSRSDDEKESRSLHGLTRSLINNMVSGVTKGFSKELQINGVGYRAQKQGSQLVMNLGYSHQVVVDEIPGITIDVPSPDRIIINGIDKQKVGQFAAIVREKRPPEPYHGKGIKYASEVIRRKEGKTGKK